MHTVQYTVHNLQYTLHTVQYTVHIDYGDIKYTVHTVIKKYIKQRTVYSAHCTV